MTDGAIGDARALTEIQSEVGYESLQYDDRSASSPWSAPACAATPGVSAKFFKALSQAGMNIELISTSEIRISVVTRADALDDAVRAVHSAFDLDTNGETAVVYGGTGR